MWPTVDVIRSSAAIGVQPGAINWPENSKTGAEGEMPLRFETGAPQASAFATACAIDGFSATIRTRILKLSWPSGFEGLRKEYDRLLQVRIYNRRVQREMMELCAEREQGADVGGAGCGPLGASLVAA